MSAMLEFLIRSDRNFLQPSCNGCITLDILLILCWRTSTYKLDLASCQYWFKQLNCIDWILLLTS